jgi:nucleoside 2-deoxyribosyltransferase
MKKIYLAGPEVFLPNSVQLFRNLKKLCKDFGFEAFSAFDGEVTKEIGLKRAEKIFLENCKLIDKVDLVIANCNRFRGAVLDDGTSFEIGYAFAKKKKIFGFINKIKTLPQIVEETVPTLKHSSGYRIDTHGFLLNEDFGNTINLMLEFSINSSGGKLVEGDLETVLKLL